MPERIARIALRGLTYAIDRAYDYAVPNHLSECLREGMRVVVPFGTSNRKIEGMVLAIAERGERDGLKMITDILDDEPVVSRGQIRLAAWMCGQYFCTFYEAVSAMLPAGLWYTLDPVYCFSDGVSEDAAISACETQAERNLVEAVARQPLRETAQLRRQEGFTDARDRLLAAGILRLRSKRKLVNDKKIRLISLTVSREEAGEYIRKYTKRSPAGCAVLEFLASSDGETAAWGDIAYYTGAELSVLKRLEKNGLIRTEYQKAPAPAAAEPEPTTETVSVALTAEQLRAVDGLDALASDAEAKAALLYGITGSGKTQVYLELIGRVLDRGGSAILMVPEIALTPQLMRTVADRFSGKTAILHSALAAGKRLEEWQRIRDGRAPLVLGTRSAVFAPLSDPTLIIIDEEQEFTYKSENSPRYHARDVAKYRVVQSKGLLLLGSATPLVESFYAARSGKYAFFTLATRYNKQALPSVMFADMRAEMMNGNSSSVSALLRAELVKNIEAGEQSILFLNRRGAFRRAVCGQCGYTLYCDNCSVPLTYHSANHRLMCHYCGASRSMEETCPECGGRFKLTGTGTQRCEDELREALTPFVGELGIIRMDSDTTSARHSHEALLSRFREENIPILLGTQMVAKGLDFENVTLVGVIDADQLLCADDYRAGERTFSMITQVVGRAGRGKKPGRAIIQTYSHPELIDAAASQDYEKFYEEEIRLRRQISCPPFGDLLVLTVSGVDEQGAWKAALSVRAALIEALPRPEMSSRLLGPSEAGVFRVNGRCRYKITLLAQVDTGLRRAVAEVLRKLKKDKSLSDYYIYADINPNEI